MQRKRDSQRLKQQQPQCPATAQQNTRAEQTSTQHTAAQAYPAPQCIHRLQRIAQLWMMHVLLMSALLSSVVLLSACSSPSPFLMLAHVHPRLTQRLTRHMHTSYMHITIAMLAHLHTTADTAMARNRTHPAGGSTARAQLQCRSSDQLCSSASAVAAVLVWLAPPCRCRCCCSCT